MDTTGQAPAFVEDRELLDLARFIREDLLCSQRGYSSLRGLTRSTHQRRRFGSHRWPSACFRRGRSTFKALYRSIIADPVYRGGRGGRSATSGKMLARDIAEHGDP